MNNKGAIFGWPHSTMQIILREHRWPALGLAVLFLLTTLPFVARMPFNWDSAQLVLGVEHFSIYMHQPHPPGYPLFIGLGKILALVMDSHTSLLLISMAFAAASVSCLYLLVWEIWSKRWLAVLIAVSFMLNPLFWLYRETALTYTVDAFAGIFLALLSHLVIKNGRTDCVYWSALALGLAGGFRPSLVILLLPFLIWQWIEIRRWWLAAGSAAILMLASLAWYVPLVMASGGYAQYTAVSSMLFRSAAQATSVFFGAPWSATWRQIDSVMRILVATLNVMLLPIGITAALSVWGLLRQSWFQSRFYLGLVLAWSSVSLFVYGFIHFGPTGYILTLVPLGYVLAAPAIRRVFVLESRLWRWMGMVSFSLLLFLHAAAFLLLSPAYVDVTYAPKTFLDRLIQNLAQWRPELLQWNAELLRENDRRIGAINQAVRRFSPQEVVVITTTKLFHSTPGILLPVPIDETFRKLAATLPSYWVLELEPQGNNYLLCRNFTTEMVAQRTVTLDDSVRSVVFALTGIPPEFLPTGLVLEPQEKEAGQPYYVGVVQGPFQFFGHTFKREKDP